MGTDQGRAPKEEGRTLPRFRIVAHPVMDPGRVPYREAEQGPFHRRVVTIPPGGSRAFDVGEWDDAIVTVQRGEVELEGLSGTRLRLRCGDLFWLAGLPLRALHSRGAEPAVLLAVSRRKVVSGDRR